ncbi:MAG TPA: hypothetical protein VEU07_02790, partial [Candidatus Acidoferrum sp.]|nr:hypothetical protein [Candidatus Acidoferrum sp.]
FLQKAGVVDLFEELVHRDGETSAEYKPRIVRELRLDLLIEDELHVALAAAEVPVPVLLFDRPWNQADLPSGMRRVSNWDEVRCHVAALAAARPT